MPTSDFTKKILLVIFGLNGRFKFVNRFLRLFNSLNLSSSEISILLICEKDMPPEFDTYEKINLITVSSKKKITGMNCIFKEMLNTGDIIRQFSYVCFVEDDNFIFPRSIIKSAEFLSRNNDYISCGGHGFLFLLMGKSKIKTIHYKMSNSLTNSDLEVRLRNFEYSLMY